MSILAAIIVFDILIIIYEIMVQIFSALYEINGLTKEQARFQVTSLLTGTGFTTAESEKMLETKKRKRLTRDIMIISYIFNISIISTLISLFTSTKNVDLEELIIGIVISLGIIFILFCTKRIPKVRIFFQTSLLKFVEKTLYREKNPIIVYDYYDKNILAEIKLNKMPQMLKDKKIKDLELEEKYNIKILYLKRKNRIISNIKDNTKLYRKDAIIILGSKEKIEKVFLKK